ncbi:MAG: hypothetical protein ACI8YI_001513 [Paracoccaceae bacterium]
MVAKKTTGQSGGAKKPQPKKGSKPATAKSEPVILDPPTKAKAAASKILAETVDVEEVKVGQAKPATNPAEKPEVKGPAPMPVSTSQGTRVFAGYLAGGAIAALFGYFAAGYINPTVDVPDNGPAIAAEYSSKLAAAEARIAALEGLPVQSLEQDIVNLKSALAEQSAQISAKLAENETSLSETLDALKAARVRLTENLSQSGGEINAVTAELVSQYGDEIDALKSDFARQIENNKVLSETLDKVASQVSGQLSAARTEVEELSTNIVNSAKSIDLTLARERLRAAIEAGKSYHGILAEIADETATVIPKALIDSAANGVASLAELQKSFPEHARRALKASVQAEAGDGMANKVMAYLKSQLGARSLDEKEGNDPDAILSRVEAMLGRGELQAAVDLARKLPANGIKELDTWLSSVEVRLNVEMALNEFSNALLGDN